jgi:putative oxidoreductase
MAATATVECIVGLILVSGRLLRPGLALLAGCVLSWMSPLVPFPADLFAGGPTLEAQYILKDIVPGAAGLVVAAKAPGRTVAGAD